MQPDINGLFAGPVSTQTLIGFPTVAAMLIVEITLTCCALRGLHTRLGLLVCAVCEQPHRLKLLFGLVASPFALILGPIAISPSGFEACRTGEF